MATYINLIKLTDQGVRNYKDTVSRAEEYWAAVKKAGGKVVQEVWTMGEYDVVTIFEAPDDETAAALSFQVSALGNVRTTTIRAFTADEMRKMIAKSKA
jgi:uncharacterized protein with GYD domain